MKKNTTHNIAWVAILACCAAITQHAAADLVALKSSVQLAGERDHVRLADIAELQGPEAQRFADLMIVQLTGSAHQLEITVQEVRRKLDEAGVHWGLVNLNGRKVAVFTQKAQGASQLLAMTSVSLETERKSKDTPDAAATPDGTAATELLSEATLRGAIANLLVHHLQTSAEDLRLSFNASDGKLLELPLASHRFELKPLASSNSDRVDVSVAVWVDGKVQNRSTITISALIRTSVAVAAGEIGKDRVITAGDIEESEQWLTPGQAAMVVSTQQCIGAYASIIIKPGQTIRHKMVRRDVVIKRGELTMIRCLVGGAALALQAEARSDGGIGETIEFRKPGERESFMATVVGRYEAVVDLGRSR